MSIFFSVKNFEKFQHYKDRSPPWIKLYNDLLEDYDFGCLQDASKLHLILIWLLASRSSNKLPYDAEWISRRINATSKVDLPALEKAGFIIKINDESELLAECLQDARPEREGERETERETERKTDTVRKPTENRFSEIWNSYPAVNRDKGSKKKAVAAYLVAITKATHEEILEGVKRYEAYLRNNGQSSADAFRWMQDERWGDEYSFSVVTEKRAAASNFTSGIAGIAAARVKRLQGEPE